MNTPAKAPLTREQIIARAVELGIATDRLRFFEPDDLAEATASGGVLADYTSLTDVALRASANPRRGSSSPSPRRSSAGRMPPG